MLVYSDLYLFCLLIVGRIGLLCTFAKPKRHDMISITVTPEIAIEIQSSIAHFENLIAKEMNISEELRYTDKIELYQSKIEELKQGLSNGFI